MNAHRIIEAIGYIALAIVGTIVVVAIFVGPRQRGD